MITNKQQAEQQQHRDEHNNNNNDDITNNINEQTNDIGKKNKKIIMKQKSSLSMSLMDFRKVPIVKLNVENLTYMPITSSTSISNKKRRKTKKLDNSATVKSIESNNTSFRSIQLESNDIDMNTATTNSNSNNNTTNNNNRTVVLSNITTSIVPYKLTAWMGPSGSGKTSLTSIIAGLKSSNDISTNSIIKVNNEMGIKLPKRYIGVVWQDDLLLSNLTVEETIYFAARLKMSTKQYTEQQVNALVETTMDELGLLHIRNNKIGSPIGNMPGISGGERKRTSVAVELVARPSLLLLDEPTSGLDATTAYSLMVTLKDLSLMGHSIATVIHQPRTDIFKLIDHLLLLSKGRVIYNGQTNYVRTYLESCPNVIPLPPETGIADWIMDTIIIDEKKRNKKYNNNNKQQQQQELLDETNNNNNNSTNDEEDGSNDSYISLPEYWESNKMTKKFILQDDDDDDDDAVATGDSSSNIELNSSKSLQQRRRNISTIKELYDTPNKFEASFFIQLKLLTLRTIKQRRGERITLISLMVCFTSIFYTSILWWQIPNTVSSIFQRNSLIFFILISQTFVTILSSITTFQQERSLLRRERAKKLYGILPYFLAKMFSDMTSNIFLPILYGIVVYFVGGLRYTVINFIKYVIALYFSFNCAQSMGFLFSIIIPNIKIAVALIQPISLFLLIIGGFYIPIADLHIGIKWASYISFARYGYSALLINEYQNHYIPCDMNGETSTISIGDINMSTTEDDMNENCPLLGDIVYESLGITGIFASYWFNILMVLLLHIFFLSSAYIFLRRSK